MRTPVQSMTGTRRIVQIGEQMQRLVARAPRCVQNGIVHIRIAVARHLLYEWNYSITPRREKCTRQCKALGMRREHPRVPIEHSSIAGRLRQRIGNVGAAMLGVDLSKCILAALAYGVRQLACEIAEEGEWLGRAPFLAHEQEGRRGLQ